MDHRIIEIQQKLQHELDEERYQHTLGVMYTSAALAMRYCCDMEQALLAGLLHDCAKCIPNEEKITICQTQGIPVSDVERANPSLLHAKLGAYLAKEQYQVTDGNVLNAISSHTTGRPEMTLLEKIVYIADYMEPGRRNLPNMEEVRFLAFQDIDACLLRILKDSLVYLKTRKMPIDPMTEQTYIYYDQTLGKKEI